jgi:hypothetical protein
MKTLGISPKAILAFLFPLVAALATALASWIATGNLSTIEIKTAAGGLIASGLALLGAYVGKPGRVVPIRPTTNPVAPRPSVQFTNVTQAPPPPPPEPPPPPPEPPAPFTPDGDPNDGDEQLDPLTSTPVESWTADPADTAGANDRAAA